VGFTTSESKSYSRPEAKVTWMPSPTRSTVAPGMFCLSSAASRSIWSPMMAPAAPPMAAPMMAPLAVEPDTLPMTPPTTAPPAAPMTRPRWALRAQATADSTETVASATARMLGMAAPRLGW
jgi:hypothetical protein